MIATDPPAARLSKSALSAKSGNASTCARSLYREDRTWRLALDIAVIGIAIMTSAGVFKSEFRLLVSWAHGQFAPNHPTPLPLPSVIIKPNPTPAVPAVSDTSESHATPPPVEKEPRKLIAPPKTKSEQQVSPVETDPAPVERERITEPLKKSEWRLAPTESNPPPIERDPIMLKRPVR